MQFLVDSKFDEKSLLLRRIEAIYRMKESGGRILFPLLRLMEYDEERLKRPMFIDLERSMFNMFIKSDQIVIDFSLKLFFRPLYRRTDFSKQKR